MHVSLDQLEPKLVWNYFSAICEVPRPSKHEDKIREYLVNVAKSLNLPVKVTAIGNVVIQKPATLGMENRKKVTIQAHMDMVSSKLESIEHDFTKDSIKAYIDGNWVRAKGTTLGSDNGMGMAMALAILASSDIPHGPLEVLITTDEETGMTGALGLDSGDISGDILLNLDSEDENTAFVGCAGGINTKVELPFTKVQVENSSDNIAVKIVLSNLYSGHSGVDIHLGRANAIKEMGNLLYLLQQQLNLNLVGITGGRLRNVIPSHCEAIVIINKNEEEKLHLIINEFINNFKVEFANIETKFHLTANSVELPVEMIEPKITRQFLLALKSCFNGVYSMNWDIKIIQTSSNLGVLKTEDNMFKLSFLQRSFNDYAKKKLAQIVGAPFELIGAKVTLDGEYPGWQPNMDSQALELVKNSYKRLFNQEVNVAAIHAGLECGLILAKAPHMDAISVGPTICDAHSPNERVSIDSVSKIWCLVKEFLANV